VPDGLQHQLRPVAVLDVGRVDDDGEDQAERVDQEVSLAAVDLLTAVVAVRPPPFGRLDRLAVEDGDGGRPLLALGPPQMPRNLSCRRSSVPSFLQVMKYQ